MSASEDAPDDGPTEAELQALVDGMAEFANETGDMVRDVLAERPESSKADGPTFAHLSDVTVTRAEMNRIADTDASWTTVSVMGGVGWHNTNTDEVVFASTPEGVPDDYVYVAPDEEVGDEYDVSESPQGATYRSPQPVTDTDGEVLTPDEITDASQIRADSIAFDSQSAGDETQYSFHALDDEVQFDMGVPEDGDTAMAYHLWIDETQRGEGVGSELMAAAESKAREEGMETLNATLGGDKDEAEAFFEALGYEPGIIEDDGTVVKPSGASWAYYHTPLDDTTSEAALELNVNGALGQKQRPAGGVEPPCSEAGDRHRGG